MILIIDFGSQTTHLISRRIKDLGVGTYICTPEEALNAFDKVKPKGIILSGGPSSVYGKEALLIDKGIFEKGVPTFGICYGHEVMAHLLGGKVTAGVRKEYGPEELTILKRDLLFAGLAQKEKVWNSHFDRVVAPPAGADITGVTASVPVASFADERKKFYGTMFHPESHHTINGKKILSNFLFHICRETAGISEINIGGLVKDIKNAVGANLAVCALSGGID